MSSPAQLSSLVVLAVSVALIDCGDAPEHHDLDIRALVFEPARSNASAADTVVWTNHDLVPHTVTDVDNSWDSGQVPSRPVPPGTSCWRRHAILWITPASTIQP